MCVLKYFEDKRDDVLGRLKTALYKSSEAERFLMSARIEINKSDMLKQCSGESVLSSLLRSAQLGLYIGNGDAYLVPYREKKGDLYVYNCELMIGYKGILKLLYRAGMTGIVVNVVHENDNFKYIDGTTREIIHERNFKERGDVLCCYAIANVGNEKIIEVMDKNELYDIKKNSDSKKRDPNKKTPWDNFFDEMAKKSVIKRLFKRLPQENLDMKTVSVVENYNDFENNNLIEENDNPANDSVAFDAKDYDTKSAAVAAII
jgi:recombination protein RecT